MKCPRCGCTDFAYIETSGYVIRKQLPLWVAVIGLVLSMFFFRKGISQDKEYILGLISFSLTVIYLIIRIRRINKDKATHITKCVCKYCHYTKYIK